MLTLNEFETIVRAGVSAPSADNRHRFHARQVADGIVLRMDFDLRKESEQHRKILTLIGMGAVIENMCLQAGALGLVVDVSVLQPTTACFDLVKLGFDRSLDARHDPLVEALEARCTNRRMYQHGSLTQSDQRALNDALRTVPGVRLQWLTGKAKAEALRLIWMAESERFLRQALHAELFEAVRFDLPWSESASEALPPGSLEIEWPLRPFFKALRKWSLMRVLNIAGMYRMLGLRAGWLPCWQAPGLGVIIVDDMAPEDRALAAGRAFERVWLAATRAGLALQPLAASTVLPLQGQLHDGARADVQHALSQGWTRLVGVGQPMMTFRIGRAAPPSVRTTRPPVTNFIEAASGAA